MTATIDKIIELATEVVDGRAVVSESSTMDVLHFDSLDCISLVVAIEDHFGIEIEVCERIEMHSLKDVAEMVDAKLSAKMPIAA